MTVPSIIGLTVEMNLDTAYEEGHHEISTWTASDLAADLIAYSSDFDGSEGREYTIEELVPYCQDWLIQFAGRP